jgi:hypothetical protein
MASVADEGSPPTGASAAPVPSDWFVGTKAPERPPTLPGLRWVQQSPPETTDGDPNVREPGDPGYVPVARRLF